MGNACMTKKSVGVVEETINGTRSAREVNNDNNNNNRKLELKQERQKR